jgi:hypothetical protein
MISLNYKEVNCATSMAMAFFVSRLHQMNVQLAESAKKRAERGCYLANN